MTLTPFKFKRYTSTLSVSSIFHNILEISGATNGDGVSAPRPRKFEVKTSENKFVLKKHTGVVNGRRTGSLPVAHGNIKAKGEEVTVAIFIRPFYTDIITLVGMCALQCVCVYSSIKGGYYLVAGFAFLSILLAYAVMVIKFNAECKTYLAAVRKCI